MRLQRKVDRYQPWWIAILEIGAFRIAFLRPTPKLGHQPERISDARTWVLPNPSGWNASHQPSRFAEAFRSPRLAAVQDQTHGRERDGRTLRLHLVTNAPV